MWMLSFIPDSWLHLAVLSIMFGGAGIYTTSLFIGLIPPLIPYKEPLRILGTVSLILGVYFYGSYDTEMTWRKKVSQAEERITQIEAEATKINKDLEIEKKKKQQVIIKTQVKIEERIKEVEKLIDAKCTLTSESIKILNDAARNPVDKK